VKNAFKIATAVRQGNAHLSSTQARAIVIALKKKGVLKTIKAAHADPNEVKAALSATAKPASAGATAGKKKGGGGGGGGESRAAQKKKKKKKNKGGAFGGAKGTTAAAKPAAD
jgi:hypothetical protein